MAIKSGWDDIGNNLVRNQRSGQVVDQFHPVYTTYKDPAPQPEVSSMSSYPSGQAPPIQNTSQVQNTTANVGQTTPQGAPTTVAQSFQQALVNRLNPTPISTSSPSVAPAIEANKLAEQRNQERNRAQLATRAAAQGTDMSGGFESQILGLGQDRAAREGQFAGNAVQRANELQNQDMTSALGMVGNLLTGNANREQQMTLAELDAAIRREALAQQGSLGGQDIALRGRLGEGQLNLGLLAQLLGNDQFGRSLGQNAAQFGATLDQNGLFGLLGLL